MKKIYNLMLLCAALIFASCSDIPAPYELNTEGGEIVEILPEGLGTAESPFNVAAANKYIEDGCDESATVYIKGIVYSITSIDTSYGNATFYISDDGKANGKLEVYRAYSLGNKKFTSEDELKEGDVVVICGKLVNYNGTYEVTQGGYIYSINGEGGNGGETTATPQGVGSQADPFNVAAAIKKCQETGETQTTEQYYVKGKVKTVDVSGVASYGNITIDMVDEGTTSVFKAFQIYSFNGAKFTDAEAAKIKVGDEVVVVGYLVNYKGNTPETAGKGTAHLVSLNGETGGGNDNPNPGQTVTPAGDGSQSNPFNVAAAIAKAVETGQTATADQYYIKGKVKSVNASGAAQYGNINIDMVDEGSNDVFMAFQINGFNGEKFTVETAATIHAGDEIVVKGNIVNYMGNTPETTGKGAGCLVLLNGKTEYGEAQQGGGSADGNSFDFSAMGYTNAQDFDGQTITLGDATLSLTKGSGSTTPKYYNTGNGIRLYGGNIATISSSKTIKKVTFTYDSYINNGNPCYATDTNTTFSPGSYDYTAQVWTLNAKSGDMSYVATTGHVRIQKIVIEYAE